MDKLNHYRTMIKTSLQRHAEFMNRHPQPGTEAELTFDEERDHYLLTRIGWTAQGRLLVPTLFVRLRDGKIWIETDWTEDGLATELLEQGVPQADIVLAFHPPEMRPYTEFAVA